MGYIKKYSSEGISEPQCVTFGVHDKAQHAEASSKESKSVEERDKDKNRQLNDVSSFTNSF